MYAPKTQRHEQCMEKMQSLQRITGGKMVPSNKGYPAIVFYSASEKYMINWYDDTKSYVVSAYSRHNPEKPRRMLKRSRSITTIHSFVNFMFGG